MKLADGLFVPDDLNDSLKPGNIIWEAVNIHKAELSTRNVRIRQLVDRWNNTVAYILINNLAVALTWPVIKEVLDNGNLRIELKSSVVERGTS